MNEIQNSEMAVLANLKEMKGDSWYQELLSSNSGTAFSITKLNVFEAEKSIPRSDRFTAEAIAAKLKNRVTYVKGAKVWHVWDGRVHVATEGDDIAVFIIDRYSDQLAMSLEAVKDTYERTAKIEASTDSEGTGDKALAEQMSKYRAAFKEHRRYRNNLNNTAGKKNLIEMLKVYLAVPSDYYDNDRDWFVMRNCVVDVRASRAAKHIVAVPHDANRPVYRYFDADYDPEAVFPALQKFLDHSLADETQALFLQKALGSVLVGAPVKTKTIIDAFGAPDGGKSMINRVINRLAPDFYFEATEHAITKGGKDADMFRDQMRKARVISFLEVKAKLDKGFILKYTGGDVIETTRKYRNSVSWYAQGIIMVMSNEGMNIGSQEEAVADRIERINFPHRFTASHPDARYRKDAKLEDKIVGEANGFLSWLLQGFVLHMLDIDDDGKIKPSESMALLKNEMQESSNTMAIFWESNAMNRYQKDLSAPESKWVPLITVIADYRKWCKVTEHPMMEEADVKAWMKRQGIYKRASGQNRIVSMVAKAGSNISF